jgi:hypothetical protein
MSWSMLSPVIPINFIPSFLSFPFCCRMLLCVPYPPARIRLFTVGPFSFGSWFAVLGPLLLFVIFFSFRSPPSLGGFCGVGLEVAARTRRR